MSSIVLRSGWSLVAAVVLVTALSLAISHSTAEAQAPSNGQITGQVPANGGFGLVVWGGGSPAQLLTAAEQRGCTLRAAWATNPQGEFVGLIYGAPSYVNAGFNALFPGAQIPPGTPLILVCVAG